MRYSYLLLPLLLCFCFSCKRENNEIQWAAIEQILIQDPQQAFLSLDSMDIHAFRSKRDKARYALLYSQALDKNCIDLQSDSIIRIAIDFYRKHGTDSECGKAYYYLGRIYENRNDMDSAVKSFLHAGTLLENTDEDHLKGLLYANIGNIYYNQKSLDEAIEMYDRSIACYTACGNRKNLGYSYHAKANALFIQEQYDRALETLDSAKYIASEQCDSTLMFSIENDRAPYLYHQGGHDLEGIKKLIYQSAREFNNGNIPPASFSLLCTIYLNQDRLDSAAHYAHRIEECKALYSEVQASGIYKQLIQIAIRKNDLASAVQYYQKYIDAIDNLYQAERGNLFQELEMKFQVRSVEQSYRMLQLRFIGTCIIFILSALLIGGLAWVNYRKRKAEINEILSFKDATEQNYAQLQQHCQQLEQKFVDKDEQTQRFIQALGNQLQSLQQIMDLTQTYEHNKDKFYSKCREYFKIMSKSSHTAFSDLQDVTNLYCDGIVDVLREQYPDLSQEELNLCCMIRLNFSTQQIRLLFNHSNGDSIYTKRSKLRTKLKLSNDMNLETFLQNCKKSPRQEDEKDC